MRRVLGIDPGPTKSGFALLDFTVKSAPIWVQGGTSEDVGMLIDSYDAEPGMLIAIEQPRALHNPMANVQVMRTAWAGGDVHGYARAKGFEVVIVGVNEWRIAFVGHSKRGENVDAKVEAMLRTLVREMPPRSSTHARDAAGVACIGARAWLAGQYSVGVPHVRERVLPGRLSGGTR
jgi:Holliday junction resolvasome RuvABC endonuclease subunit